MAFLPYRIPLFWVKLASILPIGSVFELVNPFTFFLSLHRIF